MRAPIPSGSSCVRNTSCLQAHAALYKTQSRPAVIQRVTYKTVTYEPNNVHQQSLFLAEAKKDMEQAGTWAPGRSEEYIKQIGNADLVVAGAAELHEAEKTKWKEYDRAVNQDLDQIVGLFNTIGQQTDTLRNLVTNAQANDVKDAVAAALTAITLAIGQIPEKWNIASSTGFGTLNTAINNYIGLRPWDRQITVDKISGLDIDITAQQLIDAQAAKPSKKLKKLQTDKQKLELQLGKLDTQRQLALNAVNGRPTIVEKIQEKIRASAAAQYTRGTTAYVGPKSPMQNKKQYLGEIKTTSALRNVRDKGKGILWASPWSPGVNTAFLEGGVSQGSVFKLKTAIPKNLEDFLKEGKIAEFKAAVKDQGDKAYYPFWNSQEAVGRFTIYTDELSYLMSKGYRLHEFKRKNKDLQQVMVAPAQLRGVQDAYSGR